VNDPRIPDLLTRLEHALTMQNNLEEALTCLRRWLDFVRSQHWNDFQPARDMTRALLARLGEEEEG
jgi:hypothetical protein